MDSLEFNCDLKESKHHASHCFNWTPIVLVDPDVGHPCCFASGVLGNRNVAVPITSTLAAEC